MKLRRFIHKLRMFLTITFIVSLVAVGGILTYLHNVGLPDFAKHKLVAYLKEKNIVLEFDTLKYKLNKGLVAENIKLFKTEESDTPLLQAEELIINIDKTKLLRNVVELDSVDISQGSASFDIAPDIPDSPDVAISNINGSFSVSNKQHIESVKGISLDFNGIRLVLKGRAWSTPSKKKQKKATLEQQRDRVAQYQQIKQHLDKLSWESETPPTVTIEADGDIGKLSELELNFSAIASDLTYNEATIKNLNVAGELNRLLLTLENFTFDDHVGDFSAHANLSIANHKGSFSIDSSIDFKNFINKTTHSEFAKEITFGGKNNIVAKGELILPHTTRNGIKKKFKAKLIGKAECRQISYLKANFDYLGTQFSWKDGSIFLDKLQAYHNDSEFNGRLLMTKEEIKFSSNSSLPPQFFLPFLKGRGLDRTLAQVECDDNAIFNISASGTINRNDITDWRAEGDIYIGNICYRDTKIVDASVNFELSPQMATYSDASINFDHSDWHKFKKFGGDSDGYAKAKKIEIIKDNETGFTNISLNGLESKVWATPVIKLFDMKAYKEFNNFFLEAPITIAKSNLNFRFNRNLPTPTFHTTGSVNLKHSKMSGYELHDTLFDLDITRGNTVIRNIATTIDYSPYVREKKLDKPTDGKLNIDYVKINLDIDSDRDQLILLSGISGKLWPAPVTALFAPKTAKTIEPLEFTTPVTSKKSNVVVIANGKDVSTILNLDIPEMEYNNVRLYDSSSTLTIEKNFTLFENLKIALDYTNYPKFKKFGGPKTTVAEAVSVVHFGDKITISGLKGSIWPGYVASAFAPDSAKKIDDLNFTSPIKSTNSELLIQSGKNSLVQANLVLEKFSYNGIPIKNAKGQINLTDKNGTLSDLTASIDNTNYKMRRELGGPTSSVVKAKLVNFDFDKNLVKLTGISGNFYPGRAVALFSKDAAKEIDDFRHTTPPFTSTSGVFDLSEKPKLTNLSTKLFAKGFRYNFLDKDVKGTSAYSLIKTYSRSVHFTDIKLELLNSKKYKHETRKNQDVYPVSGIFKLNFAANTPTYSGSLAINNLSIAALAKTYKFEDFNKGTFSTMLSFTGAGSNVKNLNSTKINTFQIRKSNLASIPWLGPFSRFLGGAGSIIRNERLGYSLIQDATGSYSIKNGILNLHSMTASSSSISLSGKGSYNMNSERVDMRIKVSGLNRLPILLKPLLILFRDFPIVKGAVSYKIYGDLDKLKIRPDL